MATYNPNAYQNLKSLTPDRISTPETELLYNILNTLLVDLDLYKKSPHDRQKALYFAQAKSYVESNDDGPFTFLYCVTNIVTNEDPAALAAALRKIFSAEDVPAGIDPRFLWRASDVAYDLAARTHSDVGKVSYYRRGRKSRKMELLDI